uniref:Coiled-coil domain-containing protein 16 n=1 Tax=Macrostomum lignano TaxID=282301 RepID=A0A1I8G9X2_9PLAT
NLLQQLQVAMDNKAGKSKEEIRRMMRLTAAKMQLKKPSNVVNNSEAAAAATATTSSSSSAALDDTDSVKGHPFARYNSLNQLTCILCGCPVKSSLLWRAHLASRGHRANAEAMRSRGGDRAVEILSGAGLKRRLQETSEKQQKKQPSETWHRLNELELLKEAATIKQEAKSAMKLEPAAGDGSPTDEADIDEAELELGLDCWRKKKL